MTTIQEIAEIKGLRRDIDALIQRVKALPGSAEKTLSYRRLQEGVMWLGMELKRIAETPEGAAVSAPTPYPDSKNPDSPVIHPTADGLKL